MMNTNLALCVGGSSIKKTLKSIYSLFVHGILSSWSHLLKPFSVHADSEAVCQQIADKFPDINAYALRSDSQLMNRYIHSGDISSSPRESVLKFLNFISERDVGFRSLFPELLKLMRMLAVIPALSATAERSFSALKPVKTWLTSTMSPARLNSVLLFNVRKELSSDIKSVMADFIGLNNTRRRIFCDMV
jgi:hAT family C-terminal dimerisation region